MLASDGVCLAEAEASQLRLEGSLLWRRLSAAKTRTSFSSSSVSSPTCCWCLEPLGCGLLSAAAAAVEAEEAEAEASCSLAAVCLREWARWFAASAWRWGDRLTFWKSLQADSSASFSLSSKVKLCSLGS